MSLHGSKLNEAYITHIIIFFCLALRHSPSKRKYIVDRQKSLVSGNSTFVSRDVANAFEVDAEQGEYYMMLGAYS